MYHVRGIAFRNCNRVVYGGFGTISRVQVLLSYLTAKLSFSDAATFTFARNVYAEHRRNFLEVQVYR